MRAGEPARALRMARTTGRFEAEGWRARKDGSRFCAGVVIDAVSDSAGAITGYAKITRDATKHLAERAAFDEQAAKCQNSALIGSVAKKPLIGLRMSPD